MLAVLGILALIAPAAAEARANAASRDGKVTVDVKIKRFAVADRRIVARGVLTSKVEGAGESQAAKKAVTFAVAAQAGRCHVLTLTLDDLQLDLLGLRVDLSEVNLRIHAIRRGARKRHPRTPLLRAVKQHDPVAGRLGGLGGP